MGQRHRRTSYSIPERYGRWTFLQMAQCLQLVHGTRQQSCGARKLGRCKEIQSIVTVVEELTAFGFPVNFLEIVGQDTVWLIRCCQGRITKGAPLLLLSLSLPLWINGYESSYTEK
jgi:hypothetical protein